MDFVKGFLTKYGIAGALSLVVLVQAVGLVPRISEVFGGGPPSTNAQSEYQHQELGRKLDETNKKLDAVVEQSQRNGNTTALGLRILCLQNAKSDQQRSDCARIQ